MLDFPIYVVTAGHLTDRHLHLKNVADKYNLTFEFIESFDPKDLENLPELRAKFGKNLPINSISCFLKHFEAQRRLVASNNDFCMILEDDIVFLEDSLEIRLSTVLSQIPNLKEKWLIFLGGADNKLDSHFFLEANPSLLLEAQMTTAEAYLVSRESCIERLKWFEEANLIDNALDHLITRLDEELDIQHFRPVCALATQGSITGKFETTLDASRGKHSRIYLHIKYLLNRFRRQSFPRFVASIRIAFGAFK